MRCCHLLPLSSPQLPIDRPLLPRDVLPRLVAATVLPHLSPAAQPYARQQRQAPSQGDRIDVLELIKAEQREGR